MASVSLTIVYIINQSREWPKGSEIWRHGFVLAIISTVVPMLSFVGALNYLSSGVTSIINTTGPAFTVLMAHFLLQGESLTKRKIVGVAFAFSGALMLALRGETGLDTVGQANPIGYVLVFLGLFSVSSSTIYVRRYAKKSDSFDLTSTQIFIGALILLPIIFLTGGVQITNLDGWGIFSVGYGGLIGTVAAFWLFFYSVGRFGAIAGAMIPYIVPIAATLGGALVLDEKITVGTLVGMGIIGLGIGIINSEKS